MTRAPCAGEPVTRAARRALVSPMEKNSALASIFYNPSTFVENKRIDQAADEINALHTSSATAEKQVLRLLELDRDQGHEIAKLQAVVYVLMQMLVESGAVNGAALNERVQTALTALQSDPTWNRMRGV